MGRLPQIVPPLSMGGIKRILDMTDVELEQTLSSKTVFVGTKIAAIRVLRDQNKRDEHGRLLLHEKLSPQFLESVLLRMSDNALADVMRSIEFLSDPVKIAASRILDDRHGVIHRVATPVRYQGDLGLL